MDLGRVMAVQRPDWRHMRECDGGKRVKRALLGLFAVENVVNLGGVVAMKRDWRDRRLRDRGKGTLNFLGAGKKPVGLGDGKNLANLNVGKLVSLSAGKLAGLGRILRLCRLRICGLREDLLFGPSAVQQLEE